MASNGDLFKGFIIGSILGTALGLLFAPKSGSDIRKDLRDESDELLDKAKEELEKVKKDLGELRDKIGVTIDRGKAMFEEKEGNEEDDFAAELTEKDEEQEKEKKTTQKTTRKKTTKKDTEA